MIRAHRLCRAGLVTLGLLLVATGLMAAYWWLYKLAPLRRLADPPWLAAHSEAARWAEEQRDYLRLGSSPDLFFRGDRIGYYGNREWCLWLLERLQGPGEFRHCGCTDTALALMTNRHLTSWDQWSAANRARSQEEWIQDGFAQFGVSVHLPPKPEDAEPLLRLLGRPCSDELADDSRNTRHEEAVPGFIHYNAYRWLRDSGFESRRFASTNTELAAEPEVLCGLLRFADWRAAYPGNDGLGVLAFGRSGTDRSERDARPFIVTPRVRYGVGAFIAITTIGGVLLVLSFMKKSVRANVIEPQPTSHGGPDTPAQASAVVRDATHTIAALLASLLIRNRRRNLVSHVSMHFALVALLAEVGSINRLLGVGDSERIFVVGLICLLLVLNLVSYWVNRQHSRSAWLVTPLLLLLYGGTVIPEGSEGITDSFRFFPGQFPNSLFEMATVLVFWSPLCMFVACYFLEAKAGLRRSRE